MQAFDRPRPGRARVRPDARAAQHAMAVQPLHTNFRTITKAGMLLMFLLCSAGMTPGLDRDKNIDQYGHDTWTSQSGLPGEAVYQILQTPDGYLWLRTSAGLVRFDGVRFVLVPLRQRLCVLKCWTAVEVGAT